MPWPYRVHVAQVQPAEQGQPSCVDHDGHSLGNFTGTGQCGCWYSNQNPAENSTTTTNATAAAVRWKA